MLASQTAMSGRRVEYGSPVWLAGHAVPPVMGVGSTLMQRTAVRRQENTS